LRAELRPFGGLAATGAEWRRLEAQADGSFFTSWPWIGAALETMAPAPLELRVSCGAETVGMAMLWPEGDRKLRLNLGGGAGYAAVYPEYNGILVRRGCEAAAPAALAALRASGWRSLRVDGAQPELMQAARAAGWLASLRARQPTFAVDLAALRRSRRPFLDTLSRNSRQQLRRSLRAASRLGGLELAAARDVEEALGWFGELERLHTRSWGERGKPGAFGEPFFRKFNQCLIRTAFAAGHIELLRARIGGHTAGYLYNFIYRQRVLYYQSGFDYKLFPEVQCGLVAHCLNIERHAASGAATYDFMAGAQRYKGSLGRRAGELVWFVLSPPTWQNRAVEWLKAARARLTRALARESGSTFVL
jgi:CelD/BcsL family acetyltransferase involved in cellulose biosynthesis